jgi:hypothetical protein
MQGAAQLPLHWSLLAAGDGGRAGAGFAVCDWHWWCTLQRPVGDTRMFLGVREACQLLQLILRGSSEYWLMAMC